MKPIAKIMIKIFLISGLIFAGLMAGDDYLGGNSFRTWKFIIHALVFGLFMALMSRHYYKKTELSTVNDQKIRKLNLPSLSLTTHNRSHFPRLRKTK